MKRGEETVYVQTEVETSGVQREGVERSTTNHNILASGNIGQYTPCLERLVSDLPGTHDMAGTGTGVRTWAYRWSKSSGKPMVDESGGCEIGSDAVNVSGEGDRALDGRRDGGLVGSVGVVSPVACSLMEGGEAV